MKGKTVKSDASWRVTNEEKEWIEESGKASDNSATLYMSAGCWNFDSAQTPPSKFELNLEPKQAVKVTKTERGELIDFGCETFGYPVFEGLRGKGRIEIYYGESREEAMDRAYCETLDKLSLNQTEVRDEAMGITSPITPRYQLQNSKAYRYIYVEKSGSADYDELSMMYEFLPLDYKGSFRSSDEQLNRIWDISAYTLHITSREFFIDGIKRDRWVWSGDAVQSYLMNYYLFNDNESVKRTTWLLGGKDPITSHINTIMDYTFYWFIGIYDYYLYSGDSDFLAQVYPRMQSLMEYVLGRTNANGMVEGMTGDWVFVDWADGYMDKKGELSFEQILFCRSLETMALCAQMSNDIEGEARYTKLSKELRSKLNDAFWDEAKGGYVHNRLNGTKSEQVTRYANMFGVFFDYLTPDQRQSVKQNVLFNDQVMKITTPYMRFYELEALCVMGEQERVMQEMKSYWGGMIDLDATTFWEKYNPEESGVQHLEMYGRPYGKSLCHAWGASPIYLLGKYYLGVRPTSAGYATYVVEPHLGGLEWIEGSVPTPHGTIDVYMNRKQIRVKSSGGEGKLRLPNGKTVAINAGKEMMFKY